MPHRNSTSRDQPDTPVPLRRSPRLLRKDHPAPQVPEDSEESKRGSNLNNGSRRSATLSGGICLRRSPRFSGKKITTDEFFENKSASKPNQERSSLSSVGKAEVGINPCKQFVSKTKKRVPRRSTRGNTNGCVEKIIAKDKCDGFEIFSAVGGDKEGANSGKKSGSKLEKRRIRSYGACSELIEGEGKKEKGVEKERTEVGAKRKRYHVEEGHGIDHGWTTDQELALQRAYFATKPTPHFWKKVAKLVPGKSAKDCFDKVHDDHLTPTQCRTRLRARKINSSPFSLSASKLLKPAGTLTRRPSRRKEGIHLAHKTVRQLLQKHYNVDQDYEADSFSVLESTFNPSTRALQQGVIHSTPQREQQKPGCLKKCRSSSAHKTHLLRLSSSCGATLVSPPVLKQVKNKALHEKYIDQLHCREAKRRAASVQSAKVITGKENRKESNIKKMDIIKAAKDALVFDAKDVIHQFQHIKVSPISNYSDFDDDFAEGDDDEVEDEP